MPHSISELNLNTSKIVRNSKNEDVVLTNHRKPVAVIVNYQRYLTLTKNAENDAKPMTIADLRKRMTLVDDFELPERPATRHRKIEF